MYQASIIGTGNQKYHAVTRHSGFEMSSDGLASNPVDTLLASLCACLGHNVETYLNTEKLHFDEFKAEATADLTLDRIRLGDIHVTIAIKTKVTDKSVFAALRDFITQCPIYNTLKSNRDVHIQINFEL